MTYGSGTYGDNTYSGGALVTTLDDFKQFVSDMEKSAPFHNWLRDNSGLTAAEKKLDPLPTPNPGTEGAKWIEFRDDIVNDVPVGIPQMTSLFGKALIDAGELYLKTEQTPPLPVLTESPDKTRISLSTEQIVDSAKHVWNISATAARNIVRDGMIDTTAYNVAEIAYVNKKVYHRNTTNQWYVASATFAWSSAADPFGVTPPPPPPPVITVVGRPFAANDPINTPLSAALVKDPSSDVWMQTVRATCHLGFVVNASVFAGSVNRMSEISGWTIQPVYGWGKQVKLMAPVSPNMKVDNSSDGMCIVIDDRDPDPNKWVVYNYLTSGLPRNADGTWNTYGLGKWPYMGHPWWETRSPAGNIPGKGFPITTGHMSGLCALAGTISPDDMKADSIEHALVFSMAGGGHRGNRSAAPYNASGSSGTAPDVGYRFPATRSDGSGGMNAPPGGFRCRLDPAFDVDAWSTDPARRKIARALQKYGAFDADTTGLAGIAFQGWNLNSPSHPSYPASITNLFGADLLPHMHIVPADLTPGFSILQTPAAAGGFS